MKFMFQICSCTPAVMFAFSRQEDGHFLLIILRRLISAAFVKSFNFY